MIDLASIEGIEVGNLTGLATANSSLEVASSVLKALRPPLAATVITGIGPLALTSAIATATALLAMASARCRLASPPADIQTVQDDDGNLVLRCLHPDPHSWSYKTGEKL